MLKKYINMDHMIENAITAHQVWTEKFESDLARGGLPENYEITAYDDLCEFGKWLYGLDEELRHEPDYRKIKDLHHDFHSVAAEIVQLVKLQQFEKARKVLDSEYVAITTQLQCALRAWQDAINERSETS